MDTHVNTAVQVVLTLSESEARWLLAVMQNPLVDNESVEDAVNRSNLFQSIQRVLK